jgi:hypothetical protein
MASRIAPTVAIASETSIAAMAVRLPDITKAPATSTRANSSSNAWNTKMPEACSGAATNSMMTISTVSAVSSGSLHRVRRRAMRSFIDCRPPVSIR